MTPPQDGFAVAVHLREAGRYPESERALTTWLAGHPADLRALAALAQVQLAQGDAPGAQATYERAAGIDPGSAHVQRTAARLQLRARQAEAAVASARAALAADPSDPDNGLILGMALIAAGGFDEARALADEVLARDPRKAEAYVVHAQAAQARGRREAAVEACENALRLKPHLPLWSSLGALRLELGREAEAAAALRRAVEINPDDVQSLVNLGEAQRRAGRLDEAEPPLLRAVKLAPGNVAAWSNLGAVLQQQGRPNAAREAYDRALRIDPNDPATKVNLARLLADQGRFDAAEAACRRAVEARPNLPQAHYVLAGVLRSSGRLPEAEASYRRALALQPDFPEAQLGLADALMEQLEIEPAHEILEHMLATRPTLDIFIQARLKLSIIHGSAAEIAAERETYRQAIEEARARPEKIEDTLRAGSNSRFYLAYHGLDDRPLVEALDRLFAEKAPHLGYESPHLTPRAGARDRRIRVGFISQFLCNHTIGRLYRGFIGRLDRSRFEVTVAHFPRAPRDAMRDQIDGLSDRAIDLQPRLEDQYAQLAEADLDVLFYTDIGMSTASYLLARARLAPVQVAGWGHPDTTGLTSIDYFLSGDAFEAPGAEAHYSERLIRLDRLPCYYEPVPGMTSKSRAGLGLPETGALYGCPQSLFKLHPDFDAVLGEIVERDPQAHLVFLEGQHPSWPATLRSRWNARVPRVAERALFLPRRPAAEFLNLLAEMDVLLDPPHFGSGNTLYEAMTVGAPVVTWPGPFARGRIVAGAYAQMGAGEDLIVQQLEDYAGRAVAVAHDTDGRAARRKALRAAAQRALIADTRALRAFEEFLAAAVEAVDRGERLPSGWRSEERH